MKMAGIRERIQNRKFRIWTAIVCFVLPIVGIYACYKNWGENTDAVKAYATASLLGFTLNFIFAPFVF